MTGARVLIAARLSRNDGNDASRIERDDEQAREWAEANGRTVVATSEDRNTSGSVDPFKRNGLGPWLADPSGYDEIIASSVDRLGRNFRDMCALRDWADDNGKQITVLSPKLHWPPEPDDMATPIVWDLLARFAEAELKIITKRQADARKVVRANLGFVGKPPFGFEITGEKYARQLVPVRELVPVLRHLVTRALAGDTLLSMAQWLDSQGIKALHSKTWNQKSVKNVLTNPALKGRQYAAELDKNGNQVVTHKHEGIISADDFDQLQKAMVRGPGRKNRNTEDTAMLTGSITCALCQGPMYRFRATRERADGTKNVCTYYRCKGRDQLPSTCRNMVPLSQVENWVNDWFTGDLTGTDVRTGEPFVTWAGTEIVELVTVNGDNHSAEIAEVEAELRTLDFDDPQFATRQAQLLSERARLRELPSEPSVVEERPTGRLVADVWLGLDQAARRRYLMASGMKVMVRPLTPDEDMDPFVDGGNHYVELLGSPERLTTTLRNIAA